MAAKIPSPGIKKNGITLIEVVMTVVIIGVLFVISIPSYIKVEEKAKAGEAANVLRLIQVEEKRYFLKRDEFTYDINLLLMTDPNKDPKRYFDYFIYEHNVDAPNFEAKAKRRNSANLPYRNHEYVVHKDGVVTGPLL